MEENKEEKKDHETFVKVAKSKQLSHPTDLKHSQPPVLFKDKNPLSMSQPQETALAIKQEISSCIIFHSQIETYPVC